MASVDQSTTMCSREMYDIRGEIKAVREKTKSYLEDRKNANDLVDIIGLFESDNERTIVACIKSLHKIFSSLINTEEMCLAKPPSDEADLNDLNAEEKYKVWLQERYTDCRSRLLELLTHADQNIQELSLCTLMKFVEAEGQTPLRKISEKHLTFPALFFEKIITCLLNHNHDLSSLISRFQEFLEYDDVRYFSMKLMLKNLQETPETENKDVYLENAFCVLENLSMPVVVPEDGKLTKFLSRVPVSEASLKINTYKEHKKLFTSVWLEFLRKKLTRNLYKKVLVILHEKVMPFMTNPLLLADFLTHSYDIGGAISLLALNGLFILVYSHNLDYPDFFKKLYALFEPSVFHVKYKARFFFLADLFLTSTLVPAYMIAAFAKRLARIALTAPPSSLAVAIPFIYGLVNRHPNCKVLLHRPDGPTDITADPYNMEEEDPAKANAMESSLWELKTLQQHYHHTVSQDANKMEQPLSKLGYKLDDLLELTTNDLFEKETRKKIKTVPVTFEAPEGLFGNREDKFKEIWALE